PVAPTQNYMRRSKRKFNVDTMERANMEDRTKKQKIPENDNDSTSSLGTERSFSDFIKPKPRRLGSSRFIEEMSKGLNNQRHIIVLDSESENKKRQKMERGRRLLSPTKKELPAKQDRRIRQISSLSDDDEESKKLSQKMKQAHMKKDEDEDELDVEEYTHDSKLFSTSLISRMKPKTTSLLSTDTSDTNKSTQNKNGNIPSDTKKINLSRRSQRENAKHLELKHKESEERDIQSDDSDFQVSDKNTQLRETNTRLRERERQSREREISPIHKYKRLISRDKYYSNRGESNNEYVDKDKAEDKIFRPRKTRARETVKDEYGLKKEDFSFFDSDQHMLMYPFSGPKQHSVLWDDAERLKKDRFLNDTIIDLFPRVWSDQYPKNNIHTFSSFFFTKLKDCNTPEDFKLLSKWTKGIDLFEKDILVIPIAENSHWFLALVLNPGACVGSTSFTEILDDECLDKNKPYILIVDSLGGKQRHTRKSLTNYLCKEAQEKLGVNEDDFIRPEFIQISSPIQDNYYDCGIYSLHTIHSLYKKKSEMLNSIYNKKSIIDVDEMEQRRGLENYRKFLYELLVEKSKEYADLKIQS
ncbi:hypothetical protein CU098_003854, partial [Rhizopus stolonifer]